MRSFMLTVALAMAMAMAASHAFPMAAEDGDKNAPPWLGGYNAFRGRRGFKTCDEVPGMCRGAWGSPGQDCCGRLCVNLRMDFFNCGRCGRRCRFGEMCCGGGCVNVFYDPNNCGFCGNRCKPGALALDSSESAPSGSPAYAASVHESIDGCRGKSWMAQDSSFLLSLRHPGRGGCGAQARGFDCVGGLPSPTPHSGVGGRCLVRSNVTDAVTTKETDPSSSSSSPPVWSTA
ncbi:hypothetical protein OPV22_000631 [Ensete ventricosum]|uniref:4Fe-4S ferredoxin-type domain-containing protein n=1 Tax=Ensete ventricosum TaxID=4639 RepID=A0AAV8RTC3_ENSVE|nr:hypothetical protein OPV22_000631 [Ensete ventricosum]